MLLIDLQFFTVYIPISIKKFYWTNYISLSFSLSIHSVSHSNDLISLFTPSHFFLNSCVYVFKLFIYAFVIFKFQWTLINSELQQIYSLVRDSIKHTIFFDQQKMNFGKFIFLINNIKMSQFFLFDGHQIIIIWWTSKRFKNSEMLQNFSIPKVKTIWELSQFDSSHRSRMLYFPNI